MYKDIDEAIRRESGRSKTVLEDIGDSEIDEEYPFLKDYALKSSKEHRQIAAWLQELKTIKESNYVEMKPLSKEELQHIAEALKLTKLYAVSCVEEKTNKGWKLVVRGPYTDIVCPHCGWVRYDSYAYNCPVEKVLEKVKKEDDVLPDYCEHCGTYLKAKAPSIKEDTDE